MSTILITGATSGIGLEAAASLGARGHRLCLVGRDTGKLRAAQDRVSAAGAASVETFVCDFASLTEVRSVADRVLDTLDRLDVLINNAGGLYRTRTMTRDHYESTFAINHLAGYLLTERLKPLLVRSAPARIVFTASSGHYRGTMDFDDLHFEHDYNSFTAYYRSKLANVLYTRSLATELADTGVTVNAVHPGAVATRIWDSTPRLARPIVYVVKKLTMLSPAEGGAYLTHLATDPALSGVTGQYFDRDELVEPSRRARDAELAQRLREESDRLVGLPDRPPTPTQEPEGR